MKIENIPQANFIETDEIKEDFINPSPELQKLFNEICNDPEATYMQKTKEK